MTIVATTGIGAARQLVMDALATIPGLTVYATMPDVPMAGAAWPVWAECAYGLGKMTRPLTHAYEVRVILPQGWTPETVDVADGLVEQLATALSRLGPLEWVRPVQITFSNNASNAMPGLNARVTVVQR
jgi:hypothetical protein